MPQGRQVVAHLVLGPLLETFKSQFPLVLKQAEVRYDQPRIMVFMR